MSLLDVEHLRIDYRRYGVLRALFKREASRFSAVADVSFSLDAGRTLGIVGESGSGKSSVARSLIGLQAARGSIRYDGREIVRAGRREWKRLRRDIAMMWQDPIGSLSPRLSVASLITEPLRIQGRPGGRDEADRLLKMVGLPRALGARYAHQLSGGQARRVGVARALALDPKLLICDEPTAGLDMSVQGEILNLLNDIQQRTQVAIVIITHNLNLVRHITDEVAVMYLGRFVEQGATQAIFEHPRHPYTEALLSANPSPDPDARHGRIELSGEMPSPVRRPSGCEFHGRCPYARDDCAVIVPDWTHEPERAHACRYPLSS
ncbi:MULTISPECIES: oligopeptide/dipeptide ABC transporter ATP-binding protein [Modicisalibacter]|uniref:oligopeptide/dipeptide ABC transporter ATP-binding protein n=1 Tax=Modicisalibacter TaxID=574347 RepID=UPI001CCF92B3|nr:MULTISPECIES: oligopeptide/dipeptide ABC transporter ATP-binding protein [Modicisalibacter]MBZ9538892.1 ATP-binding cassette domain-containing protein [Modicisalibacter tunisiensis]MBZ9559605.1 ATP-binding cassette domain-containing protein [Modicisalibacter sp. R2A 31.J]MBZ9577057.1 ATP-binding cassette domain-containing protein [Modicisalibacter sp. MOD 31.J]